MGDAAMWVFKLVLVLAVAYIAVVALMYATQTRMLFPTQLATGYQPRLPAAAVELEVATPDGERLHGVHLPPAGDGVGEQVGDGVGDRPGARRGEQLVLLGFGGNAWNAGSLAAYLHELFPDAEVAAFHYRGYRPSSGRPSAAALLADAPLVYDHVVESLGVETLGAGRVVAVGISLGSGIAAQLAAERPLAGLILVSPFDSLEALAGDHFPWAPVGWLLRHQMSPVESLRGLATPTALIAAERDTIVPPRRTEALRQAISNLVFDRTIAGADHNDLFHRADFRAALTEAVAQID